MLTSQHDELKKFEQRLTRLKQVLNVAEDQDVARVLGLSKAAFSARKARGAFPVEKLVALAANKPSLNIDMRYVLTGVSEELERRFAAVRAATEVAGAIKDSHERYRVQEGIVQALVGALDADEQQLISCYRQADEKGKTALLSVAISLVGAESSKKEEEGKQ